MSSFALHIIQIKNSEPLTNLYILLLIMTSSLSLFDILTKASSTTEKCLKLDLKSVQSYYETGELQDMSRIRSEYNFADAL